MPEGENRPLRFTEVAQVNGRTYTISPIVALARGIEYRGVVNYHDLLPASGNTAGDSYTVRYKGTSTAAGTETDGGVYVWADVDGTAQWILFETDTTYKANKVDGNVEGHIPSLKADGDLEDSGVSAAEVGELLTEGARKDGTYPDLTAGTANQIGSSVDIENTTPFSFRSTAGGMDVSDSVAHVSVIQGQTIRWRQRFKNNATTHMTKTNVTMTVSNGVFHMAANTDASSRKCGVVKVNKSHVYASSALIKGDGLSTTTGWCSFYYDSGATAISGVTAKALTASWLLERNYITTPGDSNVWFGPRLGNGCPKNQWAEFANVMLFDLTEMYGAGNEPTAKQFWSAFPAGYYDYTDIPSLLNMNVTGIRATGFNAFDPDTGKVRVLGGKEYEIIGTYSALSFEIAGPEDSIVGYTVTPVDGKYTPPSNGYLRATGPSEGFCVHLVWGGTRDGETESHWTSETNVPVADLFEGGMAGIRMGVNVIFDELTPEKAINRLTKRTLNGTEDWSVVDAGTGGEKYFRFMVGNNSGIGDNRILSDRFETKIITSTDANIGIRGYVTGGKSYICIRPENFDELADADAFKAWLAENPVNTVYSKAAGNYVETDVSLELDYRVSDFGTEEVLPLNSGSVPVTTELHATTAYKRNLREKLERLPETPDAAGEYVVTSDGMNLRYTPASETLVTVEDMSDGYSDELTYEAGSYVVRGGDLYMSVTDISEPEEWNGDRWIRCTVGERMRALQDAVDLIAQLEKNRGLSPDELQRIAASGHADEFFEIGDVIYIPWTDNTPSTPVTYQYPFVVADFRTAYDENDAAHPNAIILQAMYATPQLIQFDASEQVIAEEATFTSGVYYFTKSGSAWTQATVVAGDPIPAGTTYYKHRFSGTNGADVIRYGYNRYSQSAYRQWLNSESPKGTSWWTAQHDYDVAPNNHNTVPGFLDGFTSAWKAIFKKARIQTATNTLTDGGVTDVTYDKFFLPALAEVYGSATMAEVEGTYWEYWKQETGLASPSNGSSANTNDARKIPAVFTDTPGAAVMCRLRSTSRSSMRNVYCVINEGCLDTTVTQNAHRAIPACYIF